MTHSITRRSSVFALGAALAGALTRPVFADPIPLRVGIIPISGNAAYYAADKLGYFTAENLAVTSQVIRGGAAAIPAMVGGSLDVTYSNGTSIVQAIERGIDLRLAIEGTIMTSAPPDPGALLKRKGDPIRTGKDVEGKVVAVNALRDVQWMFVKAWVTATGGDPDKVQIIEFALPAMVDAIKSKRVDAALLIDPYMTAAFDDPALELLDWPMSKVFPGGPVAFFTITAETAQRRPNDIRAFVRAYKRGAAWVNANEGKEPFFNLVAEYTGLNPDLVRRMKPVPVPAEIIPGTLPRLTALMRQTGLLDTNVDLRAKIFA
ncbi:MAG TPA: ABC transporter substrate-binding protein [Candidatus Lustribacter sp.]|nr:ABC transporter substrate-binding protein [Candidatus Lustribacter sp.]